LWGDVECPPEGEKCNVKKECGDKPAFLKGGADPVVDPRDGYYKWRINTILGREIKCLSEGEQQEDAVLLLEEYAPPTKESIEKLEKQDKENEEELERQRKEAASRTLPRGISSEMLYGILSVQARGSSIQSKEQSL
jgi:hypothetical protein